MKLARQAAPPVLAAVIAVTVATWACSGDREPAQDRDSDQRITELRDPDTRDLARSGADHPGGERSEQAAERSIDKRLMIALAQAKNFHHKADVYLSQGSFDQAVDSVKQILSVSFPPGAPEAEDVKLDARARLAKLLVAQGNTDEALAVVEAGIASAGRRSFFLANLYTAKGEVHEAIATQLDEADTETARRDAVAARKSAIEAFDRSIEINRALQRALMQEVVP